MQRRQFIKTALVSSLASSAAFQALALSKHNVYRKAIGLQLYTLRNELRTDLVGTLKSVADAGYKQVEASRFPKAPDMIKVAKDFGLEVNSAHFVWEALTQPEKGDALPLGSILDQAKDEGLTHLVIPFLKPTLRDSIDDYKRLAERFNEAAMEANKAGIQLAYHNHAFEFEPLEGDLSGYDVLMAEFVPEMKFELDVFWAVVGGKDPISLMKKLKGRISQLHLKDLKEGMTLPYFGKLPKDAFKELGNGVIPMEPIIEAAAEAGVAHCHVEQDQSPHALKSINQSIQYLGTL